MRAGEPLFRIDPRPYEAELKRAAAGVDKGEADLQAATLLMNRLTDLNKRQSGSIPEKDLDAQRTLVASLTGALHQAQAQRDSSRLKLDYATIPAQADFGPELGSAWWMSEMCCARRMEPEASL